MFPDRGFKQALEARLMLSSASIALVRQARAAQQEKRDQETAAAAAAGADAVAIVNGAEVSAGASKVVKPRGSIAPGSFLGMLLSARDKAGQGLTDVQAMMQANTFTLAGVSDFCLLGPVAHQSQHPACNAVCVYVVGMSADSMPTLTGLGFFM
jgi:hypothetical protein